uniref:Transposase Tc1-like domain-containing protein n=1 Tax=Hucho hucho TaxID=62062 RepID=A0A4W5K121_9TELE
LSSIRKMSRTLKVSSSAVAKSIKGYDETGSHEDRHRKGRPRVTSAGEDKFIRVTSLRNYTSQHQLSVQRRLCESGLHGRISAKKPLLKDTNMKKRLAWAKKHDQWTLDRWKSFWLLHDFFIVLMSSLLFHKNRKRKTLE